jgi:hypothetical protein
LLQRYPPDVKVAVRYDPEHPDRAVLEPRVDWETLPANAVMGAIPLVGVGWALLDLVGSTARPVREMTWSTPISAVVPRPSGMPRERSVARLTSVGTRWSGGGRR